MKKHKHEWFYMTRGFGELPKKNVPEPEILIPGHVCQCECGVKMFYPDDPKLRTVEVEDDR